MLNFSLFVIQSNEVVPLYGDMQINPFSYISDKNMHYEPSKWPLMASNSISPESDILSMYNIVVWHVPSTIVGTNRVPSSLDIRWHLIQQVFIHKLAYTNDWPTKWQLISMVLCYIQLGCQEDLFAVDIGYMIGCVYIVVVA